MTTMHNKYLTDTIILLVISIIMLSVMIIMIMYAISLAEHKKKKTISRDLLRFSIVMVSVSGIMYILLAVIMSGYFYRYMILRGHVDVMSCAGLRRQTKKKNLN